MTGGGPTSPDRGPASSHGLSRRQFLRSGSVAAAMVVTGGVVGAGSVTSCGVWGADDNGFADVFGSRTSQVRSLGEAALGSGVLETASADGVAAMLPPEGIDVSSDGPDRLVVDVIDPQAFVAAYEARAAVELVSGPLVFVEGFPLTMTEAAVAAATALAG